MKKQNRIDAKIDVDAILVAMTEKYKNEDSTTIDGVKMTLLMNGYMKSNTEPIIRIYTEAPSSAG
jgi:phosphomannomutase